MLKLKNINKNFKGVCALNNISIEFLKEEVVAIVGDNGAGKSTLMKCITGAINPDNGSIKFKNREINNCTPEDSRALGIEMIYQNLSLCRKQNVATNIFLGCEIKKGLFLNKKEMHIKCKEIFGNLALDISPKSIVSNLSGGRQQAVAIARALISKPSLLIMDEPTAALGVKETAKVLNTIYALKKNNVSVIMITHRLSDVFQICDRVLVMKHGSIVYDLKPKDTNIVELTARIVE